MSRTVESDQQKADEDTINDFEGQLHVWLPYRRGLPPNLGNYIRQAWRRREFMREMARADIKASHQDTWFGQLWNLINPLMSGLIYFALVTVLVRGAGVPHFFVYLISGLFLFDVLESAVNKGSKSVTGAGRMINNTAFPRVLLPIAVVRNAMFELGTAVVVIVILGLATGVKPHLAWIVCIPIVIFLLIFVTGLAMFFATLQVYFRDTTRFLPFITRAWMFASPILWSTQNLSDERNHSWMSFVNPMYDLISGWSLAITQGLWPPASMWIISPAWALLSFVVGGYVFLSREREFAVRI